MIFDEAKKRIDQGIEGLNKGLPMGLPKLGSLINYVQKGRYDLIAGKTSAGKTAFVDQCYIHEPFKEYMALKDTGELLVDWLYFSLEIDPVEKITKWAAKELWYLYEEKTSLAELKSMGDFKISKEQREMIGNLDEHFAELERRVHMYDEYSTPNEIHNKILAFFKANGTIEKADGREIYSPNHPNHYVFIIIDTINLVTPEDGQNLKQAIDTVSKDMIWFRNKCGASPVILQQYNAEIVNPLRIQQKRLEPMVDDLEDSKRTSKDCNTYISIFDSSEMGLKKSAAGYDMKRLGSKFRQLKIHKNRDGERDIRLGCKFVGQIGLFGELPPASEMTDEDYENALELNLGD